MRSFLSHPHRPLDRPRTLPELDARNEREPIATSAMVGRIGLLLLIVLSLALAAQLFAGAPR
jgi:hypothetical protein